MSQIGWEAVVSFRAGREQSGPSGVAKACGLTSTFAPDFYNKVLPENSTVADSDGKPGVRRHSIVGLRRRYRGPISEPQPIFHSPEAIGKAALLADSSAADRALLSPRLSRHIPRQIYDSDLILPPGLR